MEVYNHCKDKDGSHEVGEVRQVLAVEGLSQATDLVTPGSQEMEQGDDGSLELCTTACVDGGRGEALPDDGLTNVGGNEEGDAGAKPVAFL